MPRTLFASTALLALVANQAHAEEIKTKVTAPVKTSTVKGGSPDAVSITKDGSVVLTGGTAVTMDSAHSVTNAGAITIGNAGNAIGIQANAGTAGDIVNTGTITLDEPYTAEDTDKDGDLDGPFALGGNRHGVRIDGAHSGKVANSGTIKVEGNASSGITIGGTLTGAFVHDGSTAIVGDQSVGVRTAAIVGDVRLAGTVTAQGQGSIGAEFGGDVSGAMVVQGQITATGYRYTTPPSDTSKLDADDLLQGGSALLIEGNVGGGIVLAIPPKDTDPNKPDEDGDGIEDAKEGSARVVSYGAAPAMAIGATDRAVTIGAVAGTASRYGLIVDGVVEGNGLYTGVGSTGLAIGGRGGDVAIANGIGIAGSVSASSKDAGATALKLGAGATTPELRVSGKVQTNTGDAVAAKAVAVDIAAGASLPKILNSGTISAVAGEKGSATAIVDRSGTVASVQNSGSISAKGAKADSGRNIAIDLSANTSGVNLKQTKVASGFAAPSILGSVLLGSGADRVEIEDGTLTGEVAFGAGANMLTLSGNAAQSGKVSFGADVDTMSLSGAASYSGTVNFGGGADTLTLAGTSKFSGGLQGSAGLAVKVDGGTLDVSTASQLSSLTVSKDGVLVATLTKAAGGGSAYAVSGAATFEKGATLSIKLADVATAEGSYIVLTAGTLNGLADVKTVTDLTPFMFKAELNKAAAANTIAVDVKRRTVAELGLNRSQAAAYNAVFEALSQDEDVEDVFLSITDGDVFRNSVGQMLPDHAGGTFEGLSLGARAMIRRMLDPQTPLAASGNFTVGANLAFWGSDKDAGNTAAYDLEGYAWTLTGEYQTGIGKFGASLSYLWNQHSNGSQSDVKADSYEAALHWRGSWSGISGFVRGSFGRADFESERVFSGNIGSEQVKRTIAGDWKGDFSTIAAGASGEGGGMHAYYRPSVSIDYVRLKEGGYTETGGDALDLTVDGRTSDELGLNAGLALGYDFMGRKKRDSNWFRVEAEGGWREILSGGIGDTTARFEDGDDFTLVGDGSTGGWFARARAFGGPAGFTMGGELSAEDRNGRVDLALRGSITVQW